MNEGRKEIRIVKAFLPPDDLIDDDTGNEVYVLFRYPVTVHFLEEYEEIKELLLICIRDILGETNISIHVDEPGVEKKLLSILSNTF